MAKREQKAAKTAIPYPAPKSARGRDLMLGVIKGLGRLPANDNEIEERVVACLMVAWGELAVMRDAKRREEVLSSVEALGRGIVARLMAAGDDMEERQAAEGKSAVDVLKDAVAKGSAEEFPLPKDPKNRS